MVNRRPVLAFDASTQETCYWTGLAPQGLTGTLTLVVSYIMASANTGSIEFEAAVEAVTELDATDLDSTTSFGSVNTGSESVPGTPGYLGQVSITLTNNDSLAAGDYFRLSLSRDADDGTNDTATGDLYVLAVELRDGA
jgi:hypothetical protein